MSMLDGVNQCWPLAENCVVWWEAWGAIGTLASAGLALVAAYISLGAIIATVFLGLMTLNLGRAANDASNTAIEISRGDFERQMFKDETDGLLVLVQIAGEVSVGHEWVAAEIDVLASPESSGQFLASPVYRAEVFERLGACSFPVSESVTDRLHYLDRVVSSKLLRATGMLKMVQSYAQDWGSPGSVVQLDAAHRMLAVNLILIKNDLAVVMAACQRAMHVIGIAEPDVAREVMDFAARVDGN